MKKAAHPYSLFVLTWPIFLEMFLFMLMGSADTLMLSSVSDDAVSAVGAANQFLLITILILEVISHGAAVVVAQYFGARKLDDAARISAIALSLNLMLGLVISGGFLLFGGPLLGVVNLQGDILEHARTYLTIVGGWIVLQALINTLSSIIRTYGYTRQSLFVSLGINVINIIGNYVLIFGHFGFPEMGVAGAAWSTVISRGVGVLLFLWLFYRVSEVRVQFRDYVKIRRDYVSKILKIGVPTALEAVTYHAVQSCFLYFITFLGAASLAARQYALNLSMFVFVFSMAIGMGTSIIVGRMIGAKLQDEAYRKVWGSLKWGLLLTMSFNLLIIVFREPLIRIFTQDPEIVRITSLVIVLSIALEVGRTFNLILINALRAAGDAKFTVYMGLISMVGISLPLGYYMVFHTDLGLAGIWLAIALDEWIRGVVMMLRWRSRKWDSKGLVTPEPAQMVG